MTGYEVLGDLAPTDDELDAVRGGGIPVSIHLATPVLLGQTVATGESGPLVNGYGNVTV